MSDLSGSPLDSDEPVGQVLHRMRRAAGLTGGQLAKKLGMSQPKISRIERGHGLPDPRDIARIARELGADEGLVRDLMGRAEGYHNRIADWRPTPAGLASRQRSVSDLEAQARVIRIFEPSLVVGLLQTSGYARAVLLSFQRVVVPDAELSEPAVLEAVSARVRRQEILADRTKTFHFVMAETVFKNRLCPPAEMVAQIDRIRDVASWDNVTVRIVPEDAVWEIPPQHGFTILDDRLVIMDLINTGLTTRGRLDTQKYRMAFEVFDRLAVADIGTLLDRYEDTYIDLLRTPRGGERRVGAP